MKSKLLIIAAIAALPLLTPSHAEARERCREYTKTIRINGFLEVGYGTACQRYGNEWEIVHLGGRERARHYVEDHIYNDLRNDGYRIVIINGNYDDRRYAYDRGYYRDYRKVYYTPRHHGHPKKYYDKHDHRHYDDHQGNQGNRKHSKKKHH